MQDNARIAAALDEIAGLLELGGQGYKARAYARGSEVVSTLGPALSGLIEGGGLIELDGIGPSLARQITELWNTGRSSLLERLRIEYPPGTAELTRLPGVTRRRLERLRTELDVRTIEDLRSACLAQRVRALGGFGPKTEQRLLEAIEQRDQRPVAPKRMLLADAILFTARLERQLVGQGHARHVLLAGAARRGEETLSTLDLVLVTAQPEPLFEQLARTPQLLHVERASGTAFTLEGVPVTLHAATPEGAGAALLFATGAPTHVAAVAAHADARGFRLERRGLMRADGTLAAESSDEAALYRALDLAWVPPELRTGPELATAGSGCFDGLVAERDVRGAVHCHTTYSDGKHSIEEMARAAEALGMEYITITDHSPSASYAGGVELERLQRQWDEIEEVQSRVKIRILRGTESDILADGNLDYPDAILERFDVVIASIHSRFKLDRTQMTERLVRAMQLPMFKIWGHALGRLLLHREPIDCDVDAVLCALAGGRGAIELNGDPHRLDLPPRWIGAARGLGIPFVASVDAHSTTGLRALSFAIMMARRGGLQRDEVLNTLPADDFVARVRPARLH